jgi:hypothetical protein
MLRPVSRNYQNLMIPHIVSTSWWKLVLNLESNGGIVTQVEIYDHHGQRRMDVEGYGRSFVNIPGIKIGILQILFAHTLSHRASGQWGVDLADTYDDLTWLELWLEKAWRRNDIQIPEELLHSLGVESRTEIEQMEAFLERFGENNEGNVPASSSDVSPFDTPSVHTY